MEPQGSQADVSEEMSEFLVDEKILEDMKKRAEEKLLRQGHDTSAIGDITIIDEETIIVNGKRKRKKKKKKKRKKGGKEITISNISYIEPHPDEIKEEEHEESREHIDKLEVIKETENSKESQKDEETGEN